MITVVIATHNRAAELRRTLSSLEHALPPRDRAWELLVVDNNSTDGTRAVLAEAAARATLPIRALAEPRQGKAIAVNAAIVAAGGDVIALTDDDVIVDAGYLRAVERAVEEDDAIGFGGRVMPLWTAAPPSWLVDGEPLCRTNAGVVAYDLGSQSRELGRGVWPPLGANYFFRRLAFERHGLLREDLGPNATCQRYCEDIEWVRRLLAAGERVLYVPDSLVYHPVPHDRLRRRYGLRWNFRLGRSAARMDGRPRGVATVCGVPRYVLAMALGTFADRLGAMGRETPRARFDRTQEIVYRLGMVWGYLGLPWDFDPEAEVQRVRVLLRSVPPAGAVRP